MSTAIPETPVAEFMTLADVVRHLGDVSPQRIRFQPTPGTAVLEDLLRISATKKCLCELIDGTLVEKAMGFAESRIAALIIAHLQQFVLAQDLGIVLGPDGTLQLLDDQVRIPDVAFIGWDRIADRKILSSAVPRLVPNLAVEVLSEGNTRAEMERKLVEYFQAGVELVWYVEPRQNVVRVYTTATNFQTMGLEDELEGGDVLPGFNLAVRSIFPE